MNHEQLNIKKTTIKKNITKVMTASEKEKNLKVARGKKITLYTNNKDKNFSEII